MFGKRFSRALAVTTVGSLIMVAAAFADTIVVNDLATGSDATVAPGATGSVQVYLIAQNGMGGNATHPGDINGCNAGGIGSGQATRVTFSTSDPKVTIASPGYVDLEDCDNPTTSGTFEGAKSIGYSVDSSTLAGTYTITGTASGGKADSIYNNDSMTLTVQVAVTNQAPTTPGTPGGTSPNQGIFSLSWDASTDDGLPTGSSVTYRLEHKDANDPAYSLVAQGITGPSYDFTSSNLEAEGTWVYRVRATDGSLSSAFSAASAEIKVDQSAPTTPTSSFSPATHDYDDGSVKWWNEAVTVSYGGSTDPNLADTSLGSLVAGYTANQVFATTGIHSYSGKATDFAGNQSAPTTGSVGVDVTNPTITFDSCPTSTVLLNSTISLGWTASDGTGQSGLATAATGSVNLLTSTVGRTTATSPIARDNVGNESTAATCSYTVGYNFTGFAQPVDNNGVLNAVKAGQAVPLKFRLTDANGDPVLSGVSASVSVASLSCFSGTTIDLIEEVASGSSGLQNLGDGYYQFNWKTPTTYANSCKTMRLNLGEGGPTLIGSPLAPNPDAIFHTALFQFKK